MDNVNKYFVKKLSETFQLNFTYDYNNYYDIVRVYVNNKFIFSYNDSILKKYSDVDDIIKNNIGYIAKTLEEMLPFEIFILEFNQLLPT